jgi:hypothetical protein
VSEQLSESETPLEERAEALKLAALAAHGYLGPDGALLDKKIEDTLYNRVVTAEAHKTSERKAVTVRRTELTKTLVPNMPGPGEYDDAEDPEAAEQAWSMVNQLVWRKCDSNAGGPIQDRLNGEHALILCRTQATGERGVWGVYVTRDWACIKADFIKPDQAKVARAIDQQARNGEMGSERLPEHGKKFRRELSAETKQVLVQGIDRISRQIEAGDLGDEDTAESDDDQ